MSQSYLLVSEYRNLRLVKRLELTERLKETFAKLGKRPGRYTSARGTLVSYLAAIQRKRDLQMKKCKLVSADATWDVLKTRKADLERTGSEKVKSHPKPNQLHRVQSGSTGRVSVTT